VCDSIWVTNAPEEVQVERLMRKRGMSREIALERTKSQSPQSTKVNLANIILTNSGSYDDLWKQVSEAWKEIVPGAAETDLEATVKTTRATPEGEFTVQRGRPKHSPQIAEFITRMSKGIRKLTAEDVMADFGDKAYMLLQVDGKLAGMAGWQVENLVTRTTDIYLASDIESKKSLDLLIKEVERASGELQSEASLIFPSNELAQDVSLWKEFGYERRTPETLGVQAWQDAARELIPAGGILFFKQLRTDRVLRPI
jgi:dephospho-CoA kinase